MKLLSWNVNGIRAIHKKGAFEWLKKEEYDILMLQETKARIEQFPIEILDSTFGNVKAASSLVKKGYSGTATLSKEMIEQLDLRYYPLFLEEGRMVVSQIKNLLIYNVYFPMGQKDKERLDYKETFNELLLKKVQDDIRRGLSVIICGDFNIAHAAIDLIHPVKNSVLSGFLLKEREWMDRLIAVGFIDTFRFYNPTSVKYTWWDYRNRARKRNAGWRLDYFFVSKDLKNKLISADIRTSIQGSDHCPVELVINL